MWEVDPLVAKTSNCHRYKCVCLVNPFFLILVRVTVDLKLFLETLSARWEYTLDVTHILYIRGGKYLSSCTSLLYLSIVMEHLYFNRRVLKSYYIFTLKKIYSLHFYSHIQCNHYKLSHPASDCRLDTN